MQQPPRSKSKAVVRPEKSTPRSDLSQLVADLRSGVSRLGRLAQQLSSSGHRSMPARPEEQPRPEHDVVKIIERELRTVSQLAAPAVQHNVTKEYRELADRAVKLRVPQSHAALLQAANRLQPAEALRPTSKAVRSLMQAVQAIKQGRLPFLPKETRREAQKLLDGVFGKKTAAQIARSTRIPKTIENQRLIPAAVQGMMDATRTRGSAEPPLVELLRRSMAVPLPDVQAPYRLGQPAPVAASGARTAPAVPVGAKKVPITAADLPRLAQAVPAFDTQGVAASGAYLSHADEDVHVITRSDSPLVAPNDADASRIPTEAPRATGSRRPESSVADSPAGRTAQGMTASAAQSQSSGPMRIEGTLTIPELGNIVSKFTGFMTDNGALT